MASEQPSLSTQDLDRYVTHMCNVLHSPRIRRKFGQFLSSRSFNEAETTLQFWEKCNRILEEAAELKGPKDKLNLNIVSHARFRKNVEKLLEFAEEEINFNSAQLQSMQKTFTESKSIKEFVKMIACAQTTAAELLKIEYNLFKQHITKNNSSGCTLNNKK